MGAPTRPAAIKPMTATPHTPRVPMGMHKKLGVGDTWERGKRTPGNVMQYVMPRILDISMECPNAYPVVRVRFTDIQKEGIPKMLNRLPAGGRSLLTVPHGLRLVSEEWETYRSENSPIVVRAIFKSTGGGCPCHDNPPEANFCRHCGSMVCLNVAERYPETRGNALPYPRSLTEWRESGRTMILPEGMDYRTFSTFTDPAYEISVEVPKPTIPKTPPVQKTPGPIKRAWNWIWGSICDPDIEKKRGMVRGKSKKRRALDTVAEGLRRDTIAAGDAVSIVGTGRRAEVVIVSGDRAQVKDVSPFDGGVQYVWRPLSDLYLLEKRNSTRSGGPR